MGGVISRAPCHGIQLHRWIPVEEAHNINPDSHGTVSVSSQRGRGLDAKGETDQDRLLRLLDDLPLFKKQKSTLDSDIRSWT